MRHSSAAIFKKEKGRCPLRYGPRRGIMATGARLSKGPLPLQTKLRGTYRNPLLPPLLSPYPGRHRPAICCSKSEYCIGVIGGMKEKKWKDLGSYLWTGHLDLVPACPPPQSPNSFLPPLLTVSTPFFKEG